MRLLSGQEVLVARALAKDGKVGFGFSLTLDATAARHMAEWHAGARKEKPRIEPALGHPWERAFSEGKSIPWELEPGFNSLQWIASA